MKIGIALSGGGIKGAAHIGVIKALEENGIKISVTSGTSIGSVVAALYAMGYTPDEMIKLFRYFAKSMLKTDAKHLVSNIRNTKSILGSGVISGEALEEAIQECGNLKGIKKIQDLKIPIAIPTVDLRTGKEYIFTNRKIGYQKAIPKQKAEVEEYIEKISKENKRYITNIDIGKAVRASCSYPGIFAPLDYGEYQFVDGGVLDNVPTEELKKLGAEKLLTVKFPPQNLETPRGALNIVFRSMDIIANERDTEKTKTSDYSIDLHITSSAVFDVKKVDECYEIGYQKTLQDIEKIKKKINMM